MSRYPIKWLLIAWVSLAIPISVAAHLAFALSRVGVGTTTSGGGGGISPDGSLLTGKAGGGSVGPITSLTTAYGIWTLGDEIAEPPGSGGPGYYNRTLLNGHQVLPAGGFTAGGQAQELRVAYGGNLYAISFDQVWSIWGGITSEGASGGYYWRPNDGANWASGPAPTGNGAPPTPLPTVISGATSPDSLTPITGPTGGLQTADGLFTFGAANGSGWNLTLNGVAIGGGFYAVDQIQVRAAGQLFFHRLSPPTWYVWTGNQGTPITGTPPAGPIPIDVKFSPSHPSVSAATHSTPGGFVSNVLVTMSDGSAFTGAVTVDDTTHLTGSGATIINSAALPTAGFDYVQVSATQNGVLFQAVFNAKYVP